MRLLLVAIRPPPRRRAVCEEVPATRLALSRAAALQLGLQYEGLLRQAVIYKGRNRDTAWYAIIDSEWPELDRAFRRWLDPANFDAQGNQRERLSDLTAPILKQRG